ncbi:LysM peptidoglycan-binding domain-containing protein [Niallia circulans]|uniref:LysM peptidoglycan-binding domain-containing protein n=1 Tax=Niallia circulans TaxID=1397 RepID=UPI002E1D3993
MKKKVTVLATTAILSTTFAANASASTYVVKKGDTLGQIAKTYNTTVNELKSINNLSSDLILINQKLTIADSSQSTNSSKTKLQRANLPQRPALLQKLIKLFLGIPLLK